MENLSILFNNPAWKQRRTYSHFEAWCDIVLSATDNPEFTTSLFTLAGRWNWNVSKVHRYLLSIKSGGLVKVETTNRMTKITVLLLAQCKDERKAERKTEQPTHPPSEKQDFIMSVIKVFQDAYYEANNIEYVVTCIGKERSAAGKLMKLYRRQYPDANSKDALAGMKAYFEKVVRIDDPWIKDHMSLSIIISKFNEINKILKHGKSSGKTGATPEQLAEVIAKHFL